MREVALLAEGHDRLVEDHTLLVRVQEAEALITLDDVRDLLVKARNQVHTEAATQATTANLQEAETWQPLARTLNKTVVSTSAT